MIRKLGWSIVVVIMASLGVMLGTGLARVNDTSSDLDRAWSEIGELRSAVAQANDDREAQGLAPVAVPDPVTEDPGGWLEGKAGQDGADAPPPSAAQMFTAVATFCAMRADCAGPVGPVSTTPGPGGAPGASVKGDTGDTGEKGESITGNTGPSGAPGRGITSGPSCEADGTWLTTYDDGTTFTSAGPCRVIAAPEPTPDPTPETTVP